MPSTKSGAHRQYRQTADYLLSCGCFFGLPRARNDDSIPSCFAVTSVQSALPKGEPRRTHRRKALNSASNCGSSRFPTNRLAAAAASAKGSYDPLGRVAQVPWACALRHVRLRRRQHQRENTLGDLDVLRRRAAHHLDRPGLRGVRFIHAGMGRVHAVRPGLDHQNRPGRARHRPDRGHVLSQRQLGHQPHRPQSRHRRLRWRRGRSLPGMANLDPAAPVALRRLDDRSVPRTRTSSRRASTAASRTAAAPATAATTPKPTTATRISASRAC